MILIQPCFVTRVFILIECEDISTFEHIGPNGRMVQGAGLAFDLDKRLVVQIQLETSIFILDFSLPSHF